MSLILLWKHNQGIDWSRLKRSVAKRVGVILSREVASAPGKAGVKGKFSTALERCRLFHKNNELFSNRGLLKACFMIFGSVRSSYSHPDLLLITTHFFRSHRSSTLDFHFLSHYSYIKAIMLYKGNHWTRCAGFMDALWVRLGITNYDLGTSWALPGDNLGLTWG